MDFEELRSLDLQINNTVFYLRKNIHTDQGELDAEVQRINELLAIINEMNITSPEMNSSVQKIRLYFDEKEKKLARFQQELKVLKSNVNQLIPSYNGLIKNKVKFSLDKNDKRDFFRECLLDIYMFIAFSHQDNESRVLEDLKIIGQVINFASAPNPHIVRFYKTLEGVHKSIKEADMLMKNFHENGINNEMNIIARSYQEESRARERENETFLKLIFAAFVFYMIAMIIIIRKY